MTKLTAGLAIGLMFAGMNMAAAHAASVDETCVVELRQLCPNHQTGAGLKRCRNANRANFSQACKDALAAANMTLQDVKLENR